jgi:ribulose 1,5-bisphosphate carboxylase large subunit-like protein
MKSLEWRDYMRELLKMSDDAVMKTLGTSAFHRDLAEKWVNGVDFAGTDGVIMDTPYFRSDRSCYTEITPKIKVEFECGKDVHFFMSYTSPHHRHRHRHAVTLRFKSQSEQEEVFNKLKLAFGG